MKNSSFKSKFVLIISGLALLLCCNLKCHAQTNGENNNGVFKILITEKKQIDNGKVREYDYKENGDVFLGSWEECNRKKEELEKKQYYKEQQEKKENAYDETRYKITVAKIEAEHQDYDVKFVGNYCSDYITNDMYDALADKVVYVKGNIVYFMKQEEFPSWCLDRYNELCAKYHCVYNEENFKTFKKEIAKRANALKEKYQNTDY